MSVMVQNAIQGIKEVDPNYWQSTLEQRLHTGLGSVTHCVSTSQLERKLLYASWKEYSHPDIMEGCSAFITYDIPGLLGIVDLKRELFADTLVELTDPKDTGKLTPCVPEGFARSTVDFTVLIVGKEAGRDVCFTFHPGAPIRPSEVEAGNQLSKGDLITVKEALELGLTHGKVK